MPGPGTASGVSAAAAPPADFPAEGVDGAAVTDTRDDGFAPVHTGPFSD